MSEDDRDRSFRPGETLAEFQERMARFGLKVIVTAVPDPEASGFEEDTSGQIANSNDAPDEQEE